MYTKDYIDEVINYYHTNNTSIRKTAKHYGIDRKTLAAWIKGRFPHESKHKLIKSPLKHKRYSQKTINFAMVLFKKGLTPKSIVSQLNLSDVSVLYSWIRKYNNQEVHMQKPLNKPIIKNIIYDQALKLHDIDYEHLTNLEKTKIITAAHQEQNISISVLCKELKLPRSCYYYNFIHVMKIDKYFFLRKKIKEIFYDHNQAIGYRPITQYLRKLDKPIIASEKVVRRIMKEENLKVIYHKKKRHYSSYKGETSQAPPNIINRNFKATKPNQKWLTDITEMNLGDFKVYLSPIIDCFDGKVVSYNVSKTPNADLVNTMLHNAISTLHHNEYPICHTDRGCHYRWYGWINICDRYHITRSMSKKGCSPDNSACEGFFGRLKNEFFYYRDWKDIKYDEFVIKLDGYISYYNNERIKKSLGWLSPNDYRKKFGYAA